MKNQVQWQWTSCQRLLEPVLFFFSSFPSSSSSSTLILAQPQVFKPHVVHFSASRRSEHYSGSGYGGSQASGYGRVDERISAQGGPISTSSTGSSFGSYADLSEANFQSVSSFYDSEEVTSYGADSDYEYELTSPLLAEVGSQSLIVVYNNKFPKYSHMTQLTRSLNR